MVSFRAFIVIHRTAKNPKLTSHRQYHKTRHMTGNNAQGNFSICNYQNRRKRVLLGRVTSRVYSAYPLVLVFVFQMFLEATFRFWPMCPDVASDNSNHFCHASISQAIWVVILWDLPRRLKWKVWIYDRNQSSNSRLWNSVENHKTFV